MKLNNLILSVIALLPFRALAVSAISKLARQSQDEATMYSTWQQFLNWRPSVFADGTNSTTKGEAYQRYLQQNGLEDSPVAQSEFNLLIDRMIQEGLIFENDDLIVTASTSRF